MNETQKDPVMIPRFADIIRTLYKNAFNISDSQSRDLLRRNADELLIRSFKYISTQDAQSYNSVIVRLNIIGNIISIFRKLDLLNEFETLVTLRSLLRVKKSLMEVGKISDKLQKKINEENQPDETKEKAQQSRDQSSDQSLDEINKLQDDILKIIEKKEKTRTLEIRRMLKDVTSRTIRRNLKPMLKRGQIKKLLEGRRVYYVINK